MVAVAQFDAIRSLAFGSISGTYADVGTPLDKAARAFKIDNNTNGDMMFSLDGGTTDHIFVAAGAFVLFDVQANINPQFDDKYVLAVGTQFAVKQVSAPTEESVYITVLE